MSGYIGTQPVPQATQTRQTFVATAAQTSFATGGYSVGYLDTFLNGVKLQDGVDYTATNGSDIVLTVGAALDDTLEVVAYTAFEVADAYTKAEADNRYVNVTGDTMTGSLTVGDAGPLNAKVSVKTNGVEDALVLYSPSVTIGAKLVLADNVYQGAIRSTPDGVGNTGLAFDVHQSEKMRIDTAGRVTTPYQTSFIAAANTGVSTYASGQPIVMNVQVSNVGGQYNNANGYFTAPVAGLYSFNWSIYNYAGAQFCVIKNGLYYIPTGASDHLIFSIDGARAGGFSWHMHLEANDYVSVGFRAGYSGNVYCPHGQFSGYLIG